MRYLGFTIALALTGCGAFLEASSGPSVDSSSDSSSSDSGNPVDDTMVLLSSLGSLASSVGTTGMLIDDKSTGRALRNRREIAVAIARGQGPFVTDLAQWLQLPDAMLPALGKALRDARPVFDEALSSELTERAFALLVGVTLCSDPTLRYHAWRRFDCDRMAPLAAPETP